MTCSGSRRPAIMLGARARRGRSPQRVAVGRLRASKHLYRRCPRSGFDCGQRGPAARPVRDHSWRTPYTVTVNQPSAWQFDTAVSFLPGDEQLKNVPANPAQGQYSAAAGVYTFNVQDAGGSPLPHSLTASWPTCADEWIRKSSRRASWSGMANQSSR